MVAANTTAAAHRKRMSLNRLADFSGLNRPHLLRVTSGKADATIGWLAQLADTLGIELSALFDPAVLNSAPPTSGGKVAARTGRAVASAGRSGKARVRRR